MKIAYWSNWKGAGRTTSNMACTTILGALQSKRKNVLLENHYNLRNLEEVLVNRRWNNMVREENYYYSQLGLDSLMRRMHSNLMDDNIIESSSITFCDNLLYYIPQSHVTNKEFLEYELSRVIHILLEKLEKFGDIVSIDTAGREKLSSKTILELADMVVVNLSQDPVTLDDFFENYSTLRKKAVYLVGNYNPYSKCNLKSITKRYQIDRDEIGIIPYNIEFHDALSDGTVISFLNRNYGCKKNNENYFFMREAIRSTNMILSKGMSLCMEEHKK